ncbi:hypothetical protein [Novosphingobium sp.]|uniref:hypothetical protein n=1 Tax=Novosphingobium sp. TaxID=1874826 RepID=UPI00260BECEF|nr:hypothetical protein [Novosphingobium sp.]
MFADGPRARTWGNFDLLWRVGDLSWPADVLDNPAIWFIGSYRLYLGLRFADGKAQPEEQAGVLD